MTALVTSGGAFSHKNRCVPGSKSYIRIAHHAWLFQNSISTYSGRAGFGYCWRQRRHHIIHHLGTPYTLPLYNKLVANYSVLILQISSRSFIPCRSSSINPIHYILPPHSARVGSVARTIRQPHFNSLPSRCFNNAPSEPPPLTVARGTN